jgi:translation initiation factor IF-2
MRVHELAKELGITGKDLVAKLHELHHDVKSNPMSTLTPEQVELARKSFGGPAAAAHPAPAAAKPAPKPAAAAHVPVKEAPKPVAPKPVAEKPAPPPPPPPPPAKKVIIIRGPVVVKEFAEQLGLKPNQLIAELMTMNVFASINERIDLKVAQQLADKRGFSLEHEKKVVEHKPIPKPEDKAVEPEVDRTDDLVTRPPVVTFMGHVDHGKTSLLDKIRHAHVAQGEDGGITQHLGAYMVQYHDRQITFLDTPGHAALTAMRARGANMTDIAVIVIDGVDGVMPQTKEAIQHAKAADVCVMVAINKIDLRNANVDRVKRQLQQDGVTPEDWGGDVVCCPVSAVTGDGIDHLLEMILLQADMLELKSNPRRRAQGFVIEARLEAGMGPTANLLVTRGTLHVGDAVVCGPYWGKLKALINDQGIKVRTAGPSSAVKCLGMTNVPEPGMEFKVFPDERVARSISEERMAKKRLDDISMPKRASLDDLLRKPTGPEKVYLSLVLKTDVQGSLEAIQQSLMGIKSDKVALKVVLAGVGSITENDVLLASASNAIILGFHVSKEDGVSGMAKREGVEIRLYSVIYELLDNVRDAMVGLLVPISKEAVVGHAEIRQVFEISKKGKIAGCMVVDGRVTSRARARIKREGDVAYEGSVVSLKRFQNDAAEVRDGQECGLRLGDFSDYRVGDIIEFYEMENIAQQL